MAYFDCIVGGSGGSSLTVTCNSIFAGATITCTNGVNTYTKTCPSVSPYEVIFDGLDSGVWEVSGTYSGTLYKTSVNVGDAAVTLDRTLDLYINVHGAAGAVIAFTDYDGSKTVTLDNSGNASSVHVVVDMDAPTITFEDTNVSKNPNNLSQNFSKSVTLTSATTDVYVMPDARRMFYWYGYKGEELSADNVGGHTLTYNTNDIYMSISSSSFASHLFIYSTQISGYYDALKAIMASTSAGGGYQLNIQNPYNGASNSGVVAGVGFFGEGLNTPKLYNAPIGNSITGYLRNGSTYDTLQGKTYALWLE